SRCGHPRARDSFPTRRSSDLFDAAAEEAAEREIRWVVKQHDPSRFAVAPGTADLLVVAVERLGDVAVQNKAHIGLVDAHAERRRDRKSTRLNSSHVKISYAVF